MSSAMNLSAFSSCNFDVKQWISSAFHGSEAQVNKEAYASEVAFKLQLFIQEMNSALEETAQQVQQNLPNVLRDVSSLQQEAAFLRHQMVAVQKDIKKVEHDSAKSMKAILEIDTIKRRMLEANQALREADNWTTLTSDVDKVFASGDVESITECLIGLQSSLDILTDVADYKVRAQLLESLKNRLEAMLSPSLVHAFTSQSTKSAKTYVRIFSDIRRLPQLVKYYHSCQKSKLLESWQSIVNSDASFLSWLNSFYDILSSTWHEQTRWCAQLFPDPPAVGVISDIVVDVLSSLEPSLLVCLDAAISEQNSPPSYLLDVVLLTRRLSKNIQVSFCGSDINCPPVVTLGKALYAFCRPHIKNYGNLEEKYLLSQLSLLRVTGEAAVDSVNLMSDSIPKVFVLAKECETRCAALSCGCCYPQLVATLEKFFCTYLERCSSVLEKLKGRSDCWTLFQHSLKCLQSSGEILLQLGAFECTLAHNVRSTLKQLSVQDLFSEHVNYLLTPQLQQEFASFAAQFHLRETALFPQSNAKVRQLCVTFSKFALDTVFAEIRSHLVQVPNMSVWTQDCRGPTFTLSPLEYITQIGQYLLTIPQHIEPFLAEENEALKMALRHSKQSAEGADHVADYLLGCVAQETMRTYVDVIIQIQRLTPQASVQLATDIGYLCNVLDDLGLTPLNSLQHLMALLKCSSQELVSQDGQLAQMVKTMRGPRS